MKNAKFLFPAVGVGLLFAILAVFYDYSINSRISFLGYDKKPDATVERKMPLSELVVSALAMLGGIIAGSVYRQLDGEGTIDSLKVLAQETFLSANFFRAVIASPLLFAGVYVAAKTQPDRVVAVLFAFENGFFCDIIMSRKKQIT